MRATWTSHSTDYSPQDRFRLGLLAYLWLSFQEWWALRGARKVFQKAIKRDRAAYPLNRNRIRVDFREGFRGKGLCVVHEAPKIFTGVAWIADPREESWRKGLYVEPAVPKLPVGTECGGDSSDWTPEERILWADGKPDTEPFDFGTLGLKPKEAPRD